MSLVEFFLFGMMVGTVLVVCFAGAVLPILVVVLVGRGLWAGVLWAAKRAGIKDFPGEAS